ncbi:hypothetical protein [Streptomyces sp. PU-14G]|uniref:hypothetical protein n=1 Tax=Streptomyces sp. PU-14G TaxID=2800808 RepID=UPI0034DE62E8
MGASPPGSGAVPRCQTETGREFARVVDEALRSETFRRELRGAPAGTAERLRSWAHESAEELAGAAAAEYRALCRIREGSTSRGRTAASARRVHRVNGGGLFAALAVLVPLVAAAAAVIFLVLGYVLMLVQAQRDVGASLVVTGWSGAGVAAVAGALGLGKLVVTARRHSRSGPASGPGDTPVLAEERRAEERARRAWRAALLERAVLPYLRDRLPDAGREVSAEGEASVPREASARPPALRAADGSPRGPAGPGHRGGNAGRGGRGHRSGHGDRSGPGGRERPSHHSPGHGSPDFASPDFASPDYAGPDFGSPASGGSASGGSGAGSPDSDGSDSGGPGSRGPGSRGSGSAGSDSGGSSTGDPTGDPYGSPNGSPRGGSYGSPTGDPYGGSYGSPTGDPYGSVNGSPRGGTAPRGA